MTKRLLHLLAVLLVCNNVLQAQCFPTVTSPGLTNDYITSFTIGSYTFNAGPSEEPCDYMIADSNLILMSGVSYTFTVQFGATCTNQYIGIWMDINGDDQLSTPEMLYASSTPGGGSNPISGTLTIPFGGIPGGTLLRLCTKANAPVLSTEFCSMNGGGEYQDYLIYLDSALPCTGSPNYPSIQVLACPAGTNYNLIAKLSHVYKESGYTYAWDSADDIAFTTNVSTFPDSNHPYLFTQLVTPTYIRCSVICGNSLLTSVSMPVYCILIPTALSNIGQATSVSLHNTLFTDELILTAEAGHAEAGLFILYNATGQQVIKQSVTLHAGTQNISIPTSNVANGFYYLQFVSDSYQGPAMKVLKM